jgi:hypothetical protein
MCPSIQEFDHARKGGLNLWDVCGRVDAVLAVEEKGANLNMLILMRNN